MDKPIPEAVVEASCLCTDGLCGGCRELITAINTLTAAQQQGQAVAEPMTGDLLPCPFCGKSNQDRWPCEWLDDTGTNVIRCAWCHGAAPAKTWNRRTAPPPSVPVGAAEVVGYIVHSGTEVSRFEATQAAMFLGLGKHAVCLAPPPSVPEFPERYACNGPQGTFWTNDADLANKLIQGSFDRDDWTVTDTAAPSAKEARNGR